jgi:hypothetical protein
LVIDGKIRHKCAEFDKVVTEKKNELTLILCNLLDIEE